MMFRGKRLLGSLSDVSKGPCLLDNHREAGELRWLLTLPELRKLSDRQREQLIGLLVASRALC